MTTHTNSNTPESEGFSVETYRQAMGPGHHVSLFKEQPELTGQPSPYSGQLTARSLNADRIRSIGQSLRQRRLARAKLASASNSVTVVTSRRRTPPGPTICPQC